MVKVKFLKECNIHLSEKLVREEGHPDNGKTVSRSELAKPGDVREVPQDFYDQHGAGLLELVAEPKNVADQLAAMKTPAAPEPPPAPDLPPEPITKP